MSLSSDDELMLYAAVEYAAHHWKVYPLSGKAPRIPRAHVKVENWCCIPVPEDPYVGKRCRGECGRLGHGHYDATCDVETVTRWWSGRYRGSNIGCWIPDTTMLIDVDPRHGGDLAWARLLEKHDDGPWPNGMQTISGRGDGGRHLWLRRPPGMLRMPKELTENGVELKLHVAVMAPSIHPDTGGSYQRIDGPIPTPPQWLTKLITVFPAVRVPGPGRVRHHRSSSSSPADAFNESTSWADILEPHGWECLDDDPDEDGARWLHPDATSTCSATIRHECLFVYSVNTPFEVTEAGNPKGYTKFRAFGVLDHDGDLSAAARAFLKVQPTKVWR